MLYAHSANGDGRWQPLEEHLRNVAGLAGDFAEVFGEREVASWLGWWHDAGKVTAAFQAYLHDPGPAKGPDHSSAGAVEVATACLPLAFVVAGHHGGLVDFIDLEQRLLEKGKDPAVESALARVRDLLPDEAGAPDLTAISELFRANGDPAKRRAVFRVRMLHSCLVDADCLDTERHFQPEQATERGAAVAVPELLAALTDHQGRLIAGAADTPVNGVRREVYDACVAAADQPPGFFRLTVPTGGGKTLSGMAFALSHAARHGLRRVVVALPYTSIIDQTAEVYRGVFGPEPVLEHHSAAPFREPGDESEAERRARLAADNWDAPIVVTTTVQLFESLFAARNSRLRKLHNLARSVIILDEVQTLPIHLLDPTVEVLRWLVEDYGATVVLSSATQPALPDIAATEIVPNHADHFRALARVRYELPAPGESWTFEQVAQVLSGEPQALVVLNTIKDAHRLLDHLSPADVFHLSTTLCGAHRRRVLAEVRRRLNAGEPCRLISTQVVEAGVDLDFPVVLRAMGPLDRVVQVAGRCNREGRLDSGRVIAFRLADGGMPRGAYRTGADTAELMLNGDPSLDLHDPAVFDRYFRLLFQAKDLDEKDILVDLARCKYASVAEKYRMIDDDTVSVIVRDPDEGDAVDALLAEVRRRPMTRGLWRRMQPYLVNLRRRDFEQARNAGCLTEEADSVFHWTAGYDPMRGLMRGGRSASDLVV